MDQENKEQLKQIAESLQDISKSLNRDPQAELYHSETHCPSCGRFVGTETRCPYCQTETQKRLSIRIFKVISVLISTLGLAMLLFYARHVQTAKVNINELTPLTNFAHVRIVGYADKDATMNQWGTLSFNVIQYFDKNGKLVTDKQKFKESERKEIRVTAYKKVAEMVNDNDKPRAGEEVEVEGQVRVQQNVASLLVNAPEHIRAIYDEKKPRRPLGKGYAQSNNKVDTNIPPTKVEEITEKLIKKNVKVLGSVKSVLSVENDCAIIRLENGSENGLPVFVPSVSKKKIALPQNGTKVEVFGTVENYTNPQTNTTELEISLKKPYEYIKVLPNN